MYFDTLFNRSLFKYAENSRGFSIADLDPLIRHSEDEFGYSNIS